MFVPFLLNPGKHPIVFESIPDNLAEYGLTFDTQTGRVAGKLIKDLEALSISARTVENAHEQVTTPHGIIGPVCSRVVLNQHVFGNPPLVDSNGNAKYYRCVDL